MCAPAATAQHHSPLLLLQQLWGPWGPAMTSSRGRPGAGMKPWGHAGEMWVPELVLRRGSGDRPPATTPAPDVRGNRGNGAGSTLGLAAVGLSQAARQTWRTSHPSSVSFSPFSEQPMAGEALGQLVALLGAESVPPAHQCNDGLHLKRDTAASSTGQDKPCVAKAKYLPGWLQP